MTSPVQRPSPHVPLPVPGEGDAYLVGLPWPAHQTYVACQGAKHTVVCQRRHLEFPDHDVEAELALHALGGVASECVRLLVAWRDYSSEPHLLSALMTGDAELLSRQTIPLVGPQVVNAGKRGLFAVVAGLVDLDAPFRLRLAAMTASAVARGEVVGRLMPDDRLAVEALVRSSLAAVIRRAAPTAAVSVTVQTASMAATPLLFGQRRGAVVEVTGRLPVSWLSLVAAGLALVEGRLVTRIRPAGQQWEVVSAEISSDGLLRDPVCRQYSGTELVAAAEPRHVD